MIADVAFDVPLPHPFSYRVPAGWALAPGQRVLAPLRGAARVGMVVGLREGEDAGLKPLLRLADPGPLLAPSQLDLVRWIAAESLSSVGSTCAALLPPAGPEGSAREGRAERGRAHERWSAPRPEAPKPELLVGPGRERRLLERVAATDAPVLVLTADVEAAARWAQRLAKLGRVVRLDSGVADDARARAWDALATGAARLGTGTRSALLAPLPPEATVALIDEHEAAHKPPGPPRIHSRDVVLQRAAREGLRAILTSATPSGETWWRAAQGALAAAPARPGPWPAVSLADTRGILRREPLTPSLARAVRETLAARRRVLLVVSRLASSLACDECGGVVRCETCAIALAYSRARVSLACRFCGTSVPLPDTCAGCRGRRLTPFGWGAERVEHAVRRRFPGTRIARYDPEASRGARGLASRAAAAEAEVVIGTRSALRLFGPASLGLAAFVSPDHLLRLPDFRAGERTFALMWAAAERVRPDGAMIIQSQNPTHYAFDALVRQDLATFYAHELEFRAELGYPPFRRLALLTIRPRSGIDPRRVADDLVAALRASTGLTVYPPAPDRRDRARRVVVKGGEDVPAALGAALGEFHLRRAEARGIIDAEVDPVEWPF